MSPDLVRYLDNTTDTPAAGGSLTVNNLPSFPPSSLPPPWDFSDSLVTPSSTPGSVSYPPLVSASTPRPQGDVANRPKMTTQMNPTWMADFTSPNRAKVSSSQRSKQDLSAVRKFFLVYWDNSWESASVRLIQECPNWPNWKLVDYELASLGDEILAVQLYVKAHCVWVDIGLNHTHTLTTNCTVLIRRKGVCGIDEQEQLDRFLEPKSVRRFRQGMADERTALRRLEKGKLKESAARVDNDSDIEFVEGPTVSKRRRIKVEPNSSPSPCPIILTEPGTSSMPIYIADSPFSTSATRASSFPIPSPLSSPARTPFSSRTPPLSSRWPAGLSAIDMFQGFEEIDGLMNKMLHSAKRNEKRAALMECVGDVFGRYDIPYSTYHDQRLKWDRAPQELRDKVLANSDSWSSLASRVPLK